MSSSRRPGRRQTGAAQAQPAAEARPPRPASAPGSATVSTSTGAAPAQQLPERQVPAQQTEQQARPGGAEAATMGEAAPVKQRSTPRSLRLWGVSALVACAATGITGFGAVQAAADAPGGQAFVAAAGEAATSAEQLPQVAQQARTSGDAGQFATAASDLAADIPALTAQAPDGAVPGLNSINAGVASYSAKAVNASPADQQALDGEFIEQVTRPLQDLAASDAGSPGLWPWLFFASALAAIALSAGTLVRLATVTRRLLDVPAAAGTVVLFGVGALGFTAVTDTMTWGADLTAAVVLAGGLAAGLLVSSGANKRAQEYR